MNGLDVSMFCAGSLLLFLATSATLLRCVVRIRMLKFFGLDDYLMIAAATFYLLSETFIFDAIRLTHDQDELGILKVLNRALKDVYLCEIFYILAVWFLKLSIGTFLLRLVQNSIHMHIIQGVLLVVSLYSSAYLFMIIFQCSPVDHFWDPFGKGKCIPGRVIMITSVTHAAMVGTSDLIFAILPAFVVWNLKLSKAMKISVSGLLGLGSIAGITTFVRIPYIKSLAEATALNFFAVTPRLAVWTCVEPGVGILVGSLAALRPLFRRFLGSTSDSSRTTRLPHPVKTLDISYQLESLPRSTEKGSISKVVEGSRSGRKGSLFGNMSKEELETKGTEMDVGITKTVEFGIVRSGKKGDGWTELPGAPVKESEEAFTERGGFY